MESHCNIPCIKSHVAQCQPYFSTSMFHSFVTHKQKICTLFLIHPSCNLPLSKLQLLFFKFSSTLLALVSKNESNQKQKNWTHTMSMPSFFYGILAPLPSTSTWLPKLQLLSYVKTKTITHTYNSQKSFFWIVKSMFYFKSEESSGFVSLESHMVAPKPILSCNMQNEKKLSTFFKHTIIYPLFKLTCSFHTPNKIKIKIRLSMYISYMFHSIQIENSHLWTLICVLLQIRSNVKTSSAFVSPQVQLSWLLMINLCTMPQIVTTN
jgi:hypothetical protein